MLCTPLSWMLQFPYSMSAITIDGIEYVPCKSAAETAGLVSDYIARLCRRGIVRGIKIGRA